MMNKLLLFFFCLVISNSISAQVGINTQNPLSLFHIDGNGDNSTTPTSAELLNDITVTKDGNLGIGTINPLNKLSILTTGSNTGLHLPNGASSGKVLTSDINGNAEWVSGAVQYQTMVFAKGGAIDVNCLYPDLTKLTSFTGVVVDRARDMYGASYGWDTIRQQYVAPVTGVYRIAMNIYFTTTNLKENCRVYIHRNDTIFQSPGLISITDAGSDVCAYVMGLAFLRKDDIIDLRTGAAPTGRFRYWALPGHSFLLIESL
jgi:hypothetical protein